MFYSSKWYAASLPLPNFERSSIQRLVGVCVDIQPPTCHCPSIQQWYQYLPPSPRDLLPSVLTTTTHSEDANTLHISLNRLRNVVSRLDESNPEWMPRPCSHEVHHLWSDVLDASVALDLAVFGDAFTQAAWLWANGIPSPCFCRVHALPSHVGHQLAEIVCVPPPPITREQFNALPESDDEADGEADDGDGDSDVWRTVRDVRAMDVMEALYKCGLEVSTAYWLVRTMQLGEVSLADALSRKLAMPSISCLRIIGTVPWVCHPHKPPRTKKTDLIRVELPDGMLRFEKREVFSLFVEGGSKSQSVVATGLGTGLHDSIECQMCYGRKVFLRCKDLCTSGTVVLGHGSTEDNILALRLSMSTKWTLSRPNTAGAGMYFFAVTSETPDPFSDMLACRCVNRISPHGNSAPINTMSSSLAQIWYPSHTTPAQRAQINSRDARGFLYAVNHTLNQHPSSWAKLHPAFLLFQIDPAPPTPKPRRTYAQALAISPGPTVATSRLNDLTKDPLQLLTAAQVPLGARADFLRETSLLPGPEDNFQRNALVMAYGLYDIHADVMQGLVRSWPVSNPADLELPSKPRPRWWNAPVVPKSSDSGSVFIYDHQDNVSRSNEYIIFNSEFLRTVILNCRRCVLVLTGNSDQSHTHVTPSPKVHTPTPPPWFKEVPAHRRWRFVVQELPVTDTRYWFSDPVALAGVESSGSAESGESDPPAHSALEMDDDVDDEGSDEDALSDAASASASPPRGGATRSALPASAGRSGGSGKKVGTGGRGGRGGRRGR
jgi:hypothetical protein